MGEIICNLRAAQILEKKYFFWSNDDNFLKDHHSQREEKIVQQEKKKQQKRITEKLEQEAAIILYELAISRLTIDTSQSFPRDDREDCMRLAHDSQSCPTGRCFFDNNEIEEAYQSFRI